MISTLQRRVNWRSFLWVCAFLGLAALVIDRFDLTTIWITTPLPDGSTARLANGWTTVDHPFHVTRAQSLLDALRDGHLLRWFGQHQGGYPAEFYPTGAAWLDVIVWALSLGQLPMAVVHKLLIAITVLTPALVYLWWARRDRITPGVALLAGTGHVVIAGEWWSGGWTEIALWGLVTNVAAQTAIVASLVGVLGWLREGRRRDLAVAAIAVGIAIGTNPRTFIALGAVGLAAVIVTLTQRHPVELPTLARRSLLLGALCFALGAPTLLSLLRYRDLYYFVHYSGYADVSAWWDSSNTALWQPIFTLAILGLIMSIVRPGRPVARTVGITALIYMGITAGLVAFGGQLVEQLELTRLMPFQRMLLFYLAALAVHDIVVLGLMQVGLKYVRTRGAVLAVLALALALVVVIRPVSWVPAEERGLQPMLSSAQPAIADLETAVKLADQRAAPGTSILVLGSAVSWHAPLYAPAWSDRRFFYDDWLWYWQRDHVGAYDPELEHAYPVDASALEEPYLHTHGIGAVVVTDVPGQENRAIAAATPWLQLVERGAFYDVYTVVEPTPIVTSGEQAATSIEITNQSIEATGESDGSPIVVRHNWFPRWYATVNGERVPVVKLPDGYMSIEAPAGSYTLELHYVVTWIDWLGRFLFVGGVIVVAGLLIDRRAKKKTPGVSDDTPGVESAPTLNPESER